MTSPLDDQQPIARTVGRRAPAPVGALPGRGTRTAMGAMARGLTRAPKGVYRYASHEEMIRDRERWTVEAMVAAARARA